MEAQNAGTCKVAFEAHFIYLRRRASLQAVDKKPRKAKREAFKQHQLRTGVLLKDAKNRHDSREQCRRCRAIAGTKFGNKKRIFNAAPKDELTAAEWSTHAAKSSVLTGWNAVTKASDQHRRYDPLEEVANVPIGRASALQYRRDLTTALRDPADPESVAFPAGELYPLPPPYEVYRELAEADFGGMCTAPRSATARKAVPNWHGYTAAPRELLLLLWTTCKSWSNKNIGDNWKVYEAQRLLRSIGVHFCWLIRRSRCTPLAWQIAVGVSLDKGYKKVRCERRRVISLLSRCGKVMFALCGCQRSTSAISAQVTF